MQFDITESAETLFTRHPTRFSRAEKDAFLDEVSVRLSALGYRSDELQIIKTSGGHNLLVGNPRAQYMITAHYDTPGRTGFLLFSSPFTGQALANLVYCVLCFAAFFLHSFWGRLLLDGGYSWAYWISLSALCALIFVPMLIKNKSNRNDNTSGVLGVLSLAALAANDPQLRSKCCFVLFDNEEWGLLGSAAHAKWQAKQKIGMTGRQMINLDCIGTGSILLAASAKNDSVRQSVAGHLANAGYQVTERSSRLIFLSDHINFQNSVMLSFVRPSVLGPLYIPNIHTKRDTECDLGKISGLAEALAGYINNT